MAIEKVRPGEIISSELMNYVLNKLEELENTVNGLGQLNQINIDQIIPLAGAPVDTFIRIEGSNFLYPPGNNIVRISGELVTEFAAPSTSGILTCRVPDTIDISNEDGEGVIVRVENSEYGATEASYTLYPETSQPPITIENVLTTGGSPNLNIDEPAIIYGSNFSSNASLNVIQFEWVVAGGDNVIYEATQKEVISTTPGDMRIQIVVPDIEQIPSGQVRPVSMTLTFGDRSDQFTTMVRGT